MVEMRGRLRNEAQVVIIGGGIVGCSVTDEIDGIPPNLPTVRDKDSLIYYKEEVGGLIMGDY